MPCHKKRKTKYRHQSRKTRRVSYGQPMKLVSDATKATVGLAALGIVTTAAVNLKP